MVKGLISGFLGLIVFVGCGGVSDIYKDLPNGYMYVDEAPLYKYIILKKAHTLIEQEENTIPCSVLNYTYNQNYLIAKIKFHYDMNYGTTGFKESKRLKEGQIYYYIIDTKKNIRYGAFDTYEKFAKKLKILKVDLSLEK